MGVVRDARHQPVEQAARHRRRCRRSAGRALLGDGLEVEQVGGVLRHQPDERAPARRRRGGPGRAAHPHRRRARAAAAALQRPQQRGLAGAVAPHQRGDPARREREVDVAERDRRAVHHREPARLQRRPPAAGSVGDGLARPRSARAGRARDRRASRTLSGSGLQPAAAAELDDRRYDRRGGQQLGRARRPRPGRRRSAGTSGRRTGTTRSRRCSASSTETPRSCTSRVSVASTSSAAVGSRAEVGSSSTSRRGCMVSTEPIATRCCWPPQSVRRSRPRRSAMPSRSSVSSTRRRMVSRRQAELLHPVGQLLLDRVGDEAGGGVLADVPDDVGPVARRAAGRR